MSHHVWIDKDLLRSDTFRSLKGKSWLVYLDFLRKRQWHKVKHKNRSDSYVITNNGEITYSYKEAEMKGISKVQFRNAVDELQAKGLIDIREYGSGGHNRKQTKYFIDDRWRKYGTPEFLPPRKPRKKNNKDGQGWAAYHAKKKKTSV